MGERGSWRIDSSTVLLPGLSMALLEEALRQSRQMNHGKVSMAIETVQVKAEDRRQRAE